MLDFILIITAMVFTVGLIEAYPLPFLILLGFGCFIKLLKSK